MRFLRKLFRGRTGRRGFVFPLLYIVFLPGLGLLLSLWYLFFISGTYNQCFGIMNNISPFIFFLFFSLGSFLLLPITVRRLHDINCSGWFSVLLFIPGMQVLLAICLTCLRGNHETNTYRVPPSSKGNPYLFFIGLVVILLFASLQVFNFYFLNTGGFGCHHPSFPKNIR